MKKEYKDKLCITIIILALLSVLIGLLEPKFVTDFTIKVIKKILLRGDIKSCDKAVKTNNKKRGVFACRLIIIYYLEELEKPDYDKALEAYNKLIILDPENADAYSGRGWIYANLKNYDKAIEDCNKAVTLDKNYANAYYHCGNVYRELKDYNQAIENYNKAIELKKNFKRAYRALSQLYKELNQPEKAEEYLQKAKELGYEPEEE